MNNEIHGFRVWIQALAFRMSDVGASIMGGMTKDEARAFLRGIGWTAQQIEKLEA